MWKENTKEQKDPEKRERNIRERIKYSESKISISSFLHENIFAIFFFFNLYLDQGWPIMTLNIFPAREIHHTFIKYIYFITAKVVKTNVLNKYIICASIQKLTIEIMREN